MTGHLSPSHPVVVDPLGRVVGVTSEGLLEAWHAPDETLSSESWFSTV